MSPSKPRSSTGPTTAEWDAVEQIISDKKSGYAPRVLEELTRVKPALLKLAEAKIPFREINDRFAKQMPIKISSAQLRRYMGEQFGYPTPKKKPAKAAKAGRSS